MDALLNHIYNANVDVNVSEIELGTTRTCSNVIQLLVRITCN